jgi:hypothetical protein
LSPVFDHRDRGRGRRKLRPVTGGEEVQMCHEEILRQEAGFFKITALKTYRRTAGVLFDAVPMEYFASIHAIDLVIHDRGAYSPGTVGEIERPWYRHRDQEDNLLVLAGFRDIDLYREGRLVNFRLTPHRLEMDGTIFFDRPAMLSWSRHVFHRIASSPEKGSASFNIAIRSADFDPKTNFDIYALDPKTGISRMIREGVLDQSGE